MSSSCSIATKKCIRLLALHWLIVCISLVSTAVRACRVDVSSCSSIVCRRVHNPQHTRNSSSSILSRCYRCRPKSLRFLLPLLLFRPLLLLLLPALPSPPLLCTCLCPRRRRSDPSMQPEQQQHDDEEKTLVSATTPTVVQQRWEEGEGKRKRRWERRGSRRGGGREAEVGCSSLPRLSHCSRGRAREERERQRQIDCTHTHTHSNTAPIFTPLMINMHSHMIHSAMIRTEQ